MRTEFPVFGVPDVGARCSELEKRAEDEVCVGEEDVWEDLESSFVRAGFADGQR